VICLDSGWTTLLDTMVSWILDGLVTTLLDAMVSLTFTSFDNYGFSMLWCCSYFASLNGSDDFISVHNDVQVWL
jgi:hypothetical protein